MSTTARLVVKLIERQDGSCVLYLRRIGENKRRQRCSDLSGALAHIREELGYCREPLSGIGNELSSAAAIPLERKSSICLAELTDMTMREVITKWSARLVVGLKRWVAKLRCMFGPSKEKSFSIDANAGLTAPSKTGSGLPAGFGSSLSGMNNHSYFAGKASIGYQNTVDPDPQNVGFANPQKQKS